MAFIRMRGAGFGADRTGGLKKQSGKWLTAALTTRRIRGGFDIGC
jgi:hypothetical protein